MHKYLYLLGSENEVHISIKRFLSAVGFYRGVSGQWSQIVMWFDVTAAGVVTEAIMWPLSSIQLVALTVTTKGL